MTGPRDRDPYSRPGLGYDDEHTHDRNDYADAHEELPELEVVVHLDGSVDMVPVVDVEHGAVLEVGARAAVEGWRDWDTLTDAERAAWISLAGRVVAAVKAIDVSPRDDDGETPGVATRGVLEDGPR